MSAAQPAIHESAAGLYRTREGLGPWPYRGRVAAVGIGHSPTMRRWDGDPETAVGPWAVLAMRRAIEDAGVPADGIDGLVVHCPATAGGAPWPAGQPVPESFLSRYATTSDPLDGIAQLSPEWLLRNMPELVNVKHVILAPMCMTMALTAAVEAVGRGLMSTCLAVRGWQNFPGRYAQSGPNSAPTVSGRDKYAKSAAGPNSFLVAAQFRRYLHKYQKTREMMAPFVINSRANGLLMPEGYWAQHVPAPVTAGEYVTSRPIADPARLLDNDLPIHTAAAYLVTTAERARDLRQAPAYVLGHAGAGVVRGTSYTEVMPRSTLETLEEAEELTASTARKVYEAASIAASDLVFENCYDGFSFLHPFHLEGFGFAGIGRGEALDLYQSDISITGPHPVSPSGGNIGGGRTRYWAHTDSIQQVQRRAGPRQIARSADIGLSGGFIPSWSNFIVWSSTP
jgi:hypothetical protein